MSAESQTTENEIQIEELRRSTQRMDGSRYTDRLVVLVHQAKKILAGFDAERTKRLQAEHERDALIERVKWLVGMQAAQEDTIGRLNRKLLHPDVRAPLPPEVLVDASPDRVHTESGPARAGRSVKVDVPAECHHLPNQAAWCPKCNPVPRNREHE